MRPRPLQAATLNGDERFVKDAKTGLVWHRSSLRVLYADTDRSGAVYHSNHLRYFEHGRASLMRDLDHPYRAVEDLGFVYPIVKTGINYYESLGYDDLIWIHTRPGVTERVRITFNYVITRGDEPRPVCDGFTTHCALNSRRVPVAVDWKTLETWRKFPK
ncbi:MAG: YbgC/FadM family acyl-CoA thioesterase [Pseudomonadota bacterium]